MELFGQNPHKVIQGFTEEFESTFLEHLRRCHPFSRVAANVVYNEYIQDRNHIHMNATNWLTLSEFVKYLGREGKCKVEDTPKGWYITLIQNDPFEELQGKKRAKRERAEREEEERHHRALEKQIEKARQADGDASGGAGNDDLSADGVGTEVRPEDLAAPLGFALPDTRLGQAVDAERAPRVAPSLAFDEIEEGGPSKPPRPSSVAAAAGYGASAGPPHKKSKLEQLMERDLRAKQQQAASEATAAAANRKGPGPWLAEDIVVKVMSKTLKGHGYYKQKGTVLRVIDRYIGEIEMTGSGDVIRVDQAELETVIPQPGGAVLVVAGPMRGCKGTLVAIDEKAYAAEVKVVDKRSGEKVAVRLEYEDFSKLAA